MSSRIPPSVQKGRSSKKWFPPLTFQMRLRSLKSVSFVSPTELEHSKTIFLAFRDGHKSDPFFATSATGASPMAGDNRVTWYDIDVSGKFGGCTSFFLTIHSSSSSGPELFSAFISLSGLCCLGTIFPPTGCLPEKSLVFLISGHFFVATSKMGKVRRHAYVQCPNHVLPSSNTSLTTNCLRMHRAVFKQEVANEQLKNSLREKSIELLATSTNTTNKLSLREQVFGTREKEPQTRIRERELKRQIDDLKTRIDFVVEEKVKAENRLLATKNQIQDISGEIDDRTMTLMHNLHSFSKERTKLNNWKLRYDENKAFSKHLGVTLKASELNLISSFRQLFPVQNPESKTPSLRWISLPTVEEARNNSSSEQMLAVTLGYVTHLITIFSRIADMPLRYEILYRGSVSTILDYSQQVDENDHSSFTFPLFSKGNDTSRVDYAVFLMNKDLAQLRWGFGLVTADLRNTLKNLDELMSIGNSKSVISRSGLNMSYLSPPPHSSTASTVSQDTLEKTSVKRRQSKETSLDNLSVQKLTIVTTTAFSSSSENLSKRKNSDNNIKSSTKDTSLEEKCSPKKETAVGVNWVDVTMDRTSALSIPTSFQRHKKQSHLDL